MSRITLLVWVALIGWIGFVVTEFYQVGHIPDPVSVAIFALAGLVLVLTVVGPIIIVVRRQERIMVEGSLKLRAAPSVSARVKLYMIIVTVTLGSMIFQALKSNFRISSVISWNVLMMIAVILLIESLYRLKGSRR